MIALKHVTASGRLDRCWQYDPERQLVMCVLDGHGFDVPVCSEFRPRPGAFSLVRLSEDVWRIAPACFELQRLAWVARARPYPDSRCDEFIALTHTPPTVQGELSALA